ncbi:MAG: hypothetical protein NT027_16460 [Proteobacteria bacterium]|nr:hypothetical protein [Pseudomonadota bacterium]
MKKFLLFLFTLLLIKLPVSFVTAKFNLDGDISMPWLMANDWELGRNLKFFWGQEYMGTSEVWLLNALGRIFWPMPAIIPYELNLVIAQLFLCLGASFIYVSLLRIDSDRWSGTKNFWALIVILGFLVPIMEKKAFGVAHGYSLTPLVSGLAVFFGTRPKSIKFYWYFIAGIFFGHSLYVCRLHLVVTFGLLLTLFLFRDRWLDKRCFSLLCGLAFAKFLEVYFHLSQNVYSAISIFPLSARVDNLTETFRAFSVYFGFSPFGTIETEHALWFVERYTLNWQDLADYLYARSYVLAAATLVYCLLKTPNLRAYTILYSILFVNLAVLTVTYLDLDRPVATRYLMPSAQILPLLPFLTNVKWFKNGVLVLKSGGLIVYLYSAVIFWTPLLRFSSLLHASSNSATTCLMGHGGYLAAISGLNNLVPIIAVDGWRLFGNYSKAIDINDSESIQKSCDKIIAIEHPNAYDKIMSLSCIVGSEVIRFDGTPTGLVQYPARVRIVECLVKKS